MVIELKNKELYRSSLIFQSPRTSLGCLEILQLETQLYLSKFHAWVA